MICWCAPAGRVWCGNGGGAGICLGRPIVTLHMLLAALTGSGSEPEVIRDDEGSGNQSEANNHQPTVALLFAKLLGLLLGTLGALRGGLR